MQAKYTPFADCESEVAVMSDEALEVTKVDRLPCCGAGEGGQPASEIS